MDYTSGSIITNSLFSLTRVIFNKGNHPQMALIQVSEIFLFTQIIVHHSQGTCNWVP